MFRRRRIEMSKEEALEVKKAKRAKRSEFLSRFVDEFKKIVLIAILYGKGKTVPSAVPVAAISALFGAYFTYCQAAAKEKDSLNKNGLTKTKNGIEKIATKIIDAVSGSASSDDAAG